MANVLSRVVLIVVVLLGTAFTSFAEDKPVTVTSYEKAATWMKENNKWGPEAGIVKSFNQDLEQAKKKKKTTWEIGWGLTKSKNAYFLQLTADDFTVTEISPEEAAKRGIREMRKELVFY